MRLERRVRYVDYFLGESKEIWGLPNPGHIIRPGT